MPLKMNKGVSRRNLLAGAAAVGAAGLASNARADGHEQKEGALSMPENGAEYARAPLKKEVITVSAIQSRVRAVDGGNPRRGIRDNLNHMVELIDKAQFYGGKKDLLCFHEFPITGFSLWSREEILRVAIEVPGPETETISKKAKEYGCYIKFGSYVVDDDWPNHILSITSIIDPNGDIIARDWKARNIKGVFPGFELFTTTIYNVLDQYIEMYGEDAVIPVHRTDIGNLTTSSAQREPELFRAMALKGAEMLLRTATGGFSIDDIKMCSIYNSVYSIIVNNAVSPNNPGFFDDAGSGGSTVFGPRGEVLEEAESKFEQAVTARINMAAYRSRHKLPDVHMALYKPIFDKYAPRYAPGLFAEYQPTSLQDAKRYLDEKARW
jgi:predicted amidohydrolase